MRIRLGEGSEEGGWPIPYPHQLLKSGVNGISLAKTYSYCSPQQTNLPGEEKVFFLADSKGSPFGERQFMLEVHEQKRPQKTSVVMMSQGGPWGNS